MNRMKLLTMGLGIVGALSAAACSGESAGDEAAVSEDEISIKEIDKVAERLGLGEIDSRRTRGDDRLKAQGSCHHWYMALEVDGDPNDALVLNNFRRYTKGAIFFENKGSDSRRLKCADIDQFWNGNYAATFPLAGTALDAAVRFSLGKLVRSDAAMGGMHGYHFEKQEGGRTITSDIAMYDPAHACAFGDITTPAPAEYATPEHSAGYAEFTTCMRERRGESTCARAGIRMCELTARRELAKAAAKNNPNKPASIDGLVEYISTQGTLDGQPGQDLHIPGAVLATAALHDAAGFGDFVDVARMGETTYYFFKNKKTGGDAAIAYSIHPRGFVEMVDTYLDVDRATPWESRSLNYCMRDIDPENHTATPWRCSASNRRGHR